MQAVVSSFPKGLVEELYWASTWVPRCWVSVQVICTRFCSFLLFCFFFCFLHGCRQVRGFCPATNGSIWLKFETLLLKIVFCRGTSFASYWLAVVPVEWNGFKELTAWMWSTFCISHGKVSILNYVRNSPIEQVEVSPCFSRSRFPFQWETRVQKWRITCRNWWESLRGKLRLQQAHYLRGALWNFKWKVLSKITTPLLIYLLISINTFLISVINGHCFSECYFQYCQKCKFSPGYPKLRLVALLQNWSRFLHH